MIISIWRYSHLTLAISSFLLLTLASLSGIALAIEPVIENAQPYATPGLDTITLAQAVPLLKEKYPGIQEITVDDHGFVEIKYAPKKGGDQRIYVDASTGAALGSASEKSVFFQWMTDLHRSLFAHETGRILTGIGSFLLVLIAITGMGLVAQRQNGWKRFFSRVEKTNAAPYYHTVSGRLSLFFILAIALTGSYLAVFRFLPPTPKASVQIKDADLKEAPQQSLTTFPLFLHTRLADCRKLQYPFSEFPEDYYNIQLQDREICISQFSGETLAEQVYPQSRRLADWSLRWHTGRSNSIWAFILAVSAGYILFFIYSGFAISLQRRRARPRNKYKAAEANIVILVGSENGSTYRFADVVFRQLLQTGQKTYMTDLSNFQLFPQAQHLIILTSTYGQGDPPSNAVTFGERIRQFPQQHKIRYSILGFGSRSYTHFCQYAYTIDSMLKTTAWAAALTPVYTVNDRSPQDVSEWLNVWGSQTGTNISLPAELQKPDHRHLQSLTVVAKSQLDAHAAFTIRFQPVRKQAFASGDLLAIYPQDDHRERLYSIGKIDREIHLSIKLHADGLGSGFLHALQTGDTIKARLIRNQHFRFPSQAKNIIMVCNGTGIAPFLGMIHENTNKIPIDLYCGFRYRSSYALYEALLQTAINEGRVRHIYLSLSREEACDYVSDRIRQKREDILQTLSQEGMMMICGSLAMKNGVLHVLEELSSVQPEKILTDCY